MKIAILWDKYYEEHFHITKEIFNDGSCELFTFKEFLNRSSSNNYTPLNDIDSLLKLTEVASKEDFDFILVSWGKTLFLSKEKIFNLLSSDEVQSKLFCFRETYVSGQGMRHPAKFPFIDDHAVICNIKNIKSRNFLNRKFNFSSHFNFLAGRHAELVAFIELALERDEYHNFLDNPIFNSFGVKINLEPIPFSYSPKDGILTCYPEFGSIYKNILKGLNSTGELKFSKVPLLSYYWLKNNFVIKTVRKVILGKNQEFSKDYQK